MYKWDDMTPLEVDVLIAEKVMGWKRVRDIDDFAVVFTYDDNPYHSRTAGYNFAPFENISSAWEVIDELQSRGYMFSLTCAANIATVYAPEDDEEKLSRLKDDHFRNRLIKTVAMNYGNTMPEAICKVALQTVGVDIV